MAKEVRWGILATGGIAKTFAIDLLIDPATRGVSDIKHTVVAAASSTSEKRAAEFLKEIGAPSTAKPYGSYTELVADPSIDIIYVATPHSHHYQNTRLCLEANKPVLCEKAFTTNAAQLHSLISLARSKNLFLMEAVWTRYFPIATYVRELITSGSLGNVTRVFADLSINPGIPEETWADGKHRMVNPDLAGGPLLDLGVYALNWVFWTLYHTQPEAERKAPKVQAAVTRYEATGVDEMSSMLLTFPRKEGGDAHGLATTSIRVASNVGDDNEGTPAVRIQGTKGECQVFPMIYRPRKTRVVWQEGGKVEERLWPQPGRGAEEEVWRGGEVGTVGKGWEKWDSEREGHGMFWEADEAGRRLLEGGKEGGRLGLDESLVIMEVMDEVRRQGGIKLPEKIETLDYPVDL